METEGMLLPGGQKIQPDNVKILKSSRTQQNSFYGQHNASVTGAQEGHQKRGQDIKKKHARNSLYKPEWKIGCCTPCWEMKRWSVKGPPSLPGFLFKLLPLLFCERTCESLGLNAPDIVAILGCPLWETAYPGHAELFPAKAVSMTTPPAFFKKIIFMKESTEFKGSLQLLVLLGPWNHWSCASWGRFTILGFLTLSGNTANSFEFLHNGIL